MIKKFYYYICLKIRKIKIRLDRGKNYKVDKDTLKAKIKRREFMPLKRDTQV
jgi:hypothetical protein